MKSHRNKIIWIFDVIVGIVGGFVLHYYLHDSVDCYLYLFLFLNEG